MGGIIAIVEGQGEVEALRILMRNLIDWEIYAPSLQKPLNANGRSNIVKPGGLERFLEIARRYEPDGVLILLDADEDCAAELAWNLADRAIASRLSCPIAIVCAKCEYETWFLASIESIAGHCNISPSVTYPSNRNIEVKHDAKGWLSEQMPPGKRYSETRDQARMTGHLNRELAHQHSRSFRRLEHAMEELLGVHSPTVTPKRPSKDV